MSPEDRRQALALYTLTRQETDLARLARLAAQDSIALQATTGLPWSVCIRLAQVARCRYGAQRAAEDKDMQQVRRERRILAGHVRYFTRLASEERRAAVGTHLPV
jgi:hypothetical protein